MTPSSTDLVDKGDVNALTFHVNVLVAEKRWDDLDDLREMCRRAFERGKQLWAVASYIEYRVCLEGPGPWAARMLESAQGRFSLGPLPEVLASTHTWSEVSAHLHATPEAAMVAHERVLRGEDLRRDPVAGSLPEILDLPLCLQAWEPGYALASYHADRVEAPAPVPSPPPSRRAGAGRPPSRRPGPGTAGPGTAGPATAGRASGDGARPALVPEHGADDVTSALEELVAGWTVGSNGRVAAVAAQGSAAQAVAAMGAAGAELVPADMTDAVALMAWAAADGGAHGRRRGAAPGRFGAWWVLACLGGVQDRYPLAAQDLPAYLEGLHWYRWHSGEPDMGWSLRLAVEALGGPHRGRAWAVAALDSD